MFLAMLRFSRDETAAKDAVSHAFTQALINREMLESMPVQAAKAWLYAAARNALVDMKRKESRFVALADTYPADMQASDPIDRVTVEAMLSRLPAALSTPVYLKYYQGYNATEIGAAMGLPSATVRTRLRTALSLMRAMTKGE
jgi:RNA polymerase sigma-70 factor (ECF subfamily)